MMFSITGKYKGILVNITWEDGVLTGDEEGVEALKSWAEFYETEGISIDIPGGGPDFTENLLGEPLAAYELAYRVLDEITKSSSEGMSTMEHEEGNVY